MTTVNYDVTIIEITQIDDLKLYRVKIDLTNGIVKKTAFTEISLPAIHPFTLTEAQILRLWYETPSTPQNISGSITL